MNGSLIAIIPARGGSKQLPGKALRPLAGRPLIEHSILLALRCPEVARVVVTTDSEEIAAVARGAGADVPFLRPSELALDETPMWPVVRHAVAALDVDASSQPAVLLLQPTSPARLPEDVAAAVMLLESRPDADGVIGVTELHPNPIWAAMIERDGALVPLVPEAHHYGRRQDVPRVLGVNGAVYLWRTSLVREHEADPRAHARLLPLLLPRERAIDIDSQDDLDLAETLVGAGIVRLPWLD